MKPIIAEPHNQLPPVTLIAQHGSDQELRQIILYFTRHSLHILENMLFAYYQSTNSKTKDGRRKSIARAINQHQSLKNIRDITLSNRCHPLYDFSTKNGTEVLQALQASDQEKILIYLRDEMRFVEIKTFNDFLKTIYILSTYRGFMEHYHERIKNNNLPNKEEEEIFYWLGRILTPYFSGLLEGQLKRRRWKSNIHDAITVIKTGREYKKQARQVYQNEIKTRKSMDKGKRQRLQRDMKIFRQKYLKWFPDYKRATAYNLENFHNYYFAIGKEKLLELKNETGAKSFDEIEKLYKLHHDIGLKIALSVGFLEEKWRNEHSEAVASIKNKEKFSDLVKKLPQFSNRKTDQEEIIKIRNHIAHGRLLMMQDDIIPQRVFQLVTALLNEEGEKGRAQQFKVDIKRICKNAMRLALWRQQPQKQDSSKTNNRLIWTKEMEKSFWPPKHRKKLAYIIEGNGIIKKIRYKSVRHQARLWVNALKTIID